MKRGISLLAVVCLLVVAGCASPTPQTDAKPEAPPVQGAAVTAPTPGDRPFTLPVLRLDDVMGAALEGRDAPFIRTERCPDLIRTVIEALGGATKLADTRPAGTPRFFVMLYLSLSETISVDPVSSDEVAVTARGKGGTVRSTALVQALEALNGLRIPFDHSAMQRVKADLGADWVRKDLGVQHTEWINEAAAMRLSVTSWESVVTDGTGRWMPADRYARTGVFDTVTAKVRGPGRAYEAVRHRPVQEKTGAPFWGTSGLQVDVVGRTGGLSLACDSTVWSEDKATREVAQKSVDQDCPTVLDRFTVDLGDAITPTWAFELPPTGHSAALTPFGQGYRLVLAQGANLAWEGQRGPQQWQVTAGSSEWLLDPERGELRPAPLAWPGDHYGQAPPLMLPDGRLVGVRGAKFVIQDSARGTEAELANVDGDVVALTRVGPTMLAYSLSGSRSNGVAGSLWQLDWPTREPRLVAEQGWPVGVLADGRAVAQRGRRTGAIIAWRPDAPGVVETISPSGVSPYHAIVSPDGRRLAYFQAESGSAADYPRVDAVAIWNADTGQTSTTPLPGLGHVDRIAWDESGNLTFLLSRPVGTALLQYGPSGEMVSQPQAGETGVVVGRDGCALLIRRNDGVYRYRPDGCSDQAVAREPVLLFTERQVLGWGDLIGFPRGTGMEILDMKTGGRYWAPGLTVPYVPVPLWVQFGPLRPESGFVALRVQTGPQVAYQITPVTPIQR